MLEFLFDKLAGLQACNFVKNRLQHKCFPMKSAKFLRALSYRELGVQQETLRNFSINGTLFEKYSPRTTISFLLLGNEKIKPKALLEIL